MAPEMYTMACCKSDNLSFKTGRIALQFRKVSLVHYRKHASGPMTKYNRNFELSIEDLDRIEGALRDTKSKLVSSAADKEEVREIHELLGRLHNQKTFFRPRKGPYISG